MNDFAISGLLTGISSLAMGLFVLSKNPAGRLNRLWLLFTASVAVWGFGSMWIALEADAARALLAWRLAFSIGVVWIPIFFYHFVTVFCDLRAPRLLLINYLIAAAFFPFILGSPLFFGDVRHAFSSFYYSLPGSPFFHLFFLWWAWLVAYAHYQVFKVYRHTSGFRRNQFKYFFIAFALAYGSGSLDYLPIFEVNLYPYGNFGIIFYPIIMTYAIVKYRVMDITVVMHKGLTYALLLAGVLVPVYVAVLISHRATLFSIPPLVAGTLVFASGLWVVVKNPRVTTNVTFGLLCLSASFWLFGFFLIYSTSNEGHALVWGKWLHVGIIYVPALFYHFCVSFLNRPGPTRSVWLFYGASTAFLLLLPGDLLLNGQYQYFWGAYPKAGALHPVFLLYFVTVGGLSLYRLFLGYRSEESRDPSEATRIKFVFWSFLVGYASAVDFAQNYGFNFYPVGFAFVSLWVLLVTYAIAKYQLLDISLIFSRTHLLPYVQGLGIFLSFYVLTLVLIRVFTDATEYLLAAILLASFVLCAELLVGIQRRMERAVGKALFRERHDAYETLSAFSRDLVTILDLQHLNERIISVLSRVLNIPAVSLFLLDKEKQVYALVSSQGVDAEVLQSIRLPSTDPLARKLALTKVPIVREELEYTAANRDKDESLETLKSMRSEACIPLINKERLVGFCNLGPRAKHEMYSTDDLELLTTLAQNAAIALDNAMLYEDVKKSQLLMRRTDRLRSLETIAGGFAHEIRNPLTSIKTFIQLAPERKDDADFIGGFSRVVNDDVHRIERLIEEILDYARYMKPKLTLEDLNDIVSSCLYFVQVKADSLGIGIERDLAPSLPYVMLDRQQIKQVLLNLLLNALDAMKEGGGQLTIRTHRLVKAKGQEWVQIEVTDSGPGIEPGNLEHIFDPFYTTKHESGEREGTGLGLAIVHQIVQEHHGTIEVNSQMGRGTTFLVNLPGSSQVTQTSEEQEEHEKAGPVGR